MRVEVNIIEYVIVSKHTKKKRKSENGTTNKELIYRYIYTRIYTCTYTFTSYTFIRQKKYADLGSLILLFLMFVLIHTVTY